MQTTYLSLNKELSPALQDIAIGVKTARDNTMKNMGDIIDEENYADFGRLLVYIITPRVVVLWACIVTPTSQDYLKAKKSLTYRFMPPKPTRNDFSSGGAYVVDHNGRKVFTECDEMGTLVFFDGSIPHGVDPSTYTRLSIFHIPVGA